MAYIHILITTELYVPCVHPTGSTLITSVCIGYEMGSSPQGCNAPITIWG